MSGFEALAIAGGVGIVLLIAGVPLAFVFATVGLLGIFLIEGAGSATILLRFLPHRAVSNYLLVALPMFLLFGYLAERTGMVHGTYVAASKWFSGFSGALGVATTVAAGVFAAATGSTASASALFGRISVPELRRAGYSKGVSIGCVAAAGLIAVTIPPSIPLMIYGMLTRESVIKLFAAGVIPGVMQVVIFSLVVMVIAKFSRGIEVAEVTSSWAERFKSLIGIWPIMVVAFAILGSIYGGIATITESAAAGLFCAILITLVKKQLTAEIVTDASLRTAGMTVMIFAILIGGLVFATFLTLSGVAPRLAEMIGNLPMAPWQVMVMMVVFYTIFGMFVDGISMLVLTVPVLAPAAVTLGYPLLWFGVFATIMIELGAITPPIGLNIFVIKGTVPDATLEECFHGVLPFYSGIVALLAVMIAFPEIVLWLPSLIGR